MRLHIMTDCEHLKIPDSLVTAQLLVVRVCSLGGTGNCVSCVSLSRVWKTAAGLSRLRLTYPSSLFLE